MAMLNNQMVCLEVVTSLKAEGNTNLTPELKAMLAFFQRFVCRRVLTPLINKPWFINPGLTLQQNIKLHT